MGYSYKHMKMKQKIVMVIDNLCGVIERATSENATDAEIQTLPSIVSCLANLTSYAVFDENDPPYPTAEIKDKN